MKPGLSEAAGLLERDDELERFAGLLRRAAEGAGCCLVLHGETGIGKTSLLRAAQTLSPPNAAWLWGACEPLLSPAPLTALIDLVDRLPPSLALAVRSGRATPEVLIGMLSLLRDRDSALVLVVEDLQWADGATLELLRYLGRRIEQTHSLLVLSYNDKAPAAGPALSQLLGSLPAQHTVRLPLQPLSEPAVAELARRAGRRPAGLHKLTQGNPFFVTEVLASDGTALPAAVQDAVLARAGRLSASGRDLLELVSIAPGGLEPEVLGAVLDDAAPAIDECTGAGLLIREPDVLRFRHELARRAIEAACPPMRAVSLHHAILDSLDGRQVSAARRVHHAQRAELPAAVLRLARLAAVEAAQVGAHREAAAMYLLALNQDSTLPDSERGPLWRAAAASQAAVLALDAALHSRRQSLRLARQAGDPVAEGRDLHEIARLLWYAGDVAGGKQHAKLAIRTLAAADAPRERALAMAVKAQLHLLDDDLSRALGWGRRALAIFETLGDPEGLAHALNTVGLVRLIRRDSADAWGHLERSLAIARANELDEQVSRAYVNMASMALMHRHRQAVREHCAQGISWAEARNQDLYVASLTIRAACGDIERGQWAAARADLQRLRSLPGLTPIEQVQSAQQLARLDRREGVLPVTVVPAAPDIDAWYSPRSVAAAEAAWLRGHQVEAATIAAAGLALALRSREGWRIGMLACWQQRSGVAASLPAGAAVAPPCALELAGEHGAAAAAWAALDCPYDQALALLGGTLAQVSEALVLFEGLGAWPAADIARKRLRSFGVTKGTRGPYRNSRDDTLGLTPRQRSVLQALEAGLSNREIAQRLHRSERTVEGHVAALLAKLGVATREQAVARARALHAPAKTR